MSPIHGLPGPYETLVILGILFFSLAVPIAAIAIVLLVIFKKKEKPPPSANP